MHATYSPEDNKLRVYPGFTRVDSLLDEAEYSAFKASGYKWAAKQECFVAPSWSPAAEDWALELCEEIGDEDYSPEERSADRAERFAEYRDKRAGEAGAAADTFEAGPAAFGHQNRGRAERQARRHDRYRGRAVTQWSKAEYWQTRTAGVIRHALHRSSASVRRGRILRLEAEQRKHEKSRQEHAARFAQWRRVLELAGADQTITRRESADFIGIDRDASGPAACLAYTLASTGGGWNEYEHPRTGRKTSLYSLMTDAADPITAREAATLWLALATDPADTGSSSARWTAHYELRLTYERAMLENEGGTAAAADMEPGGWICTSNRTGSVFTDVATGWKQIQSVNKSPTTGRVVSVKVWGTSSGYTRASGYKEYATVPALVSINIERLPEGAYRPPTDEERAAFAKETKERKAREKAERPAAPQLINPTDADAERLQAAWNAAAEAEWNEGKQRGRYYGDFQPSTVRRMTQAEYSQHSKGSYARFETVNICENGKRPPRWHQNRQAEPSPVACKIRKAWGNAPGGWTGKAESVIVITDKPQKPLPLEWEHVLDTAAQSATA